MIEVEKDYYEQQLAKRTPQRRWKWYTQRLLHAMNPFRLLAARSETDSAFFDALVEQISSCRNLIRQFLSYISAISYHHLSVIPSSSNLCSQPNLIIIIGARDTVCNRSTIEPQRHNNSIEIIIGVIINNELESSEHSSIYIAAAENRYYRTSYPFIKQR